MIEWSADVDIYLHRHPVDFRKSVNGLSVIVEEIFEASPFSRALFVFSNKRRNQLKGRIEIVPVSRYGKKGSRKNDSSGLNRGKQRYGYPTNNGYGYCVVLISVI